MERARPLRRIRSHADGFWAGFTAPWAGFRYMKSHPALWRHGVLPIACNLVLSVLLLAGLVYLSIHAFGWIDSLFPPGIWWGIVEVFFDILVAVLLFALLIAAWITFQGIFCGYFYSLLAREVEIQLGLAPEAMREVPLVYQVVDALLDLTVLATVALGCLVLGFVPVVGPVAALVIGGYFNCFVFGMDYLDYPQALRARSRRMQREFARRHRTATLGLGASVTIITFLPIINSVLLTTATVGAVLLYRKLQPEEIPASDTQIPAG